MKPFYLSVPLLSYLPSAPAEFWRAIAAGAEALSAASLPAALLETHLPAAWAAMVIAQAAPLGLAGGAYPLAELAPYDLPGGRLRLRPVSSSSELVDLALAWGIFPSTGALSDVGERPLASWVLEDQGERIPLALVTESSHRIWRLCLPAPEFVTQAALDAAQVLQTERVVGPLKRTAALRPELFATSGGVTLGEAISEAQAVLPRAIAERDAENAAEAAAFDQMWEAAW